MARDSNLRRRTVIKFVAGSSIGITGLAGCVGGGDGGGGDGSSDGGDGGSDGGDGSSGDGGDGGGGGMRQITALGGITGGSGYQQCLVFQQILHQNFDNIRVTVSGTDGWKTDAKLMWAQGNAEFGIVPAGDAYNILHGKDPYAEEHNYIMQAYPAVPPTYLHAVVPKNSGIQGYEDLAGKRINVLPRGALSASLQPQVMDALGLEPQKYFHYPHQEAASALKQGDIDVAVGAGVAAPYQELSQQTPLRVVSLAEDLKPKISESIPWLGFASVDFGQYYNGAGESTVPAPWTVMACLASLEEDFVYDVVKTVFENVEMAGQIYEPAQNLAPEMASQTRVPVHPGAYKYFQEQGVEFSDDLKPPESLPMKE